MPARRGGPLARGSVGGGSLLGLVWSIEKLLMCGEITDITEENIRHWDN